MRAVEELSMKVLVGVIIEENNEIFLLEDLKTGLFNLPTASRLGIMNDQDSLLGKLKQIGITLSEYCLFSVFENIVNKSNCIYYRAGVVDKLKITAGKFYAFDKIPFLYIQDKSSKTMLLRYINEKKLDVFGIYVGKET